MTASEAIREARRLWGDSAGITNVWEVGARCVVGCLLRGRFVALGEGASWDEALDAADPERKAIRIRPREAACRRRR